MVVGAVMARGWTWSAGRPRPTGCLWPAWAALWGRFRAGQASLAARPNGGGRPKKLRLAEHVAALREHLAAEPDLDLAARGEHLQQSEGLRVSVQPSGGQCVPWLDTKKKTLNASGKTRWSARRGAGRRRSFCVHRIVVFVDESGPTGRCARATATRPRDSAPADKPRATAGATPRSWPP